MFAGEGYYALIDVGTTEDIVTDSLQFVKTSAMRLFHHEAGLAG